MDVFVAPDHIGIKTDGGVSSLDVWQGKENSCAIHAQYHVLKDYGYTGTVDDLKTMAIDNGWYSPDTGTLVGDVGKLLEANGVPCNVYVNANEYNLISELAQGKRVIVGLDSGEMWHEEGPLRDFFEKITGGGADHALVVSGMNMSDPDDLRIILTDSGTGQAAVEYPIDKFMDAWKDGNCTMWVPKDPPERDFNLNRLVNFDWELGHVPNLGNMSYEEVVAAQEEFEKINTDDNWCDDVVDYYANGSDSRVYGQMTEELGLSDDIGAIVEANVSYTNAEDIECCLCDTFSDQAYNQ